MAEEEKEEEPKKGGLMRIIMLALGAIALIGIGVGAGYFLFGGKPADPSTEIEEIIERNMKEAEEAKAAGSCKCWTSKKGSSRSGKVYNNLLRVPRKLYNKLKRL